jgi:hypothetical protein
MTLEQFAAMSVAERAAWLESDEHRFNCAAWGEGQMCCLELLAERLTTGHGPNS